MTEWLETKTVDITHHPTAAAMMGEIGHARYCFTCEGRGYVPVLVQVHPLLPFAIPVGFEDCPCCEGSLRPGWHTFFCHN